MVARGRAEPEWVYRPGVCLQAAREEMVGRN